jgi:hypothetical protein
MDTNATSVSREVSELYISKINSLITAGREPLIDDIVAEYDQNDRAAREPVRTAA